MAKIAKRIAAGRDGLDRNKLHTVDEAVKLLKARATAKFDETVEVSMRLGVNPRHADQMVRGTVVLPHGTGKTRTVLAVCEGEAQKHAEEAGADFVLTADDAVTKIQGGWLEFDVVVATPDMMRHLSKVGRVLGPRGLMPNPKLGTVTQDVARAVSEQKAGKVEFRVDKNGIVHCAVGKKSFELSALLGNTAAVMEAIKKAKPSASKGIYVRKVVISSTMGPGLRIDPNSALTLDAA